MGVLQLTPTRRKDASDYRQVGPCMQEKLVKRKSGGAISDALAVISRSQALPGNAMHPRLCLVALLMPGRAWQAVRSQAEPGNEDSRLDKRSNNCGDSPP